MNVISKIYQGFFMIIVVILVIGVYMISIGNRSVDRASAVLASVEKRQAANELSLSVVQVQQWLTDISATRGLEGFDDGFDEAAKHADMFRRKVSELKSMLQGTQHAHTLTQIERDFEEYYSMGKQMAKAYIEGGPDLGNPMMDKFDPFAEKLTEGVDTIVKAMGDALAESLEESKQAARSDQFFAMIIMVVSFLGGSLLAWRLCDKLRTSLSAVAGQLSTGSEEVSVASTQISQSSQALASGATQQASSLQETSAALEQVTSQTRQNADNANQATDIAVASRQDAETGAVQMNEMISAMEGINKSSMEIGKIIKVIEEIAFQTNLLALNAAVEAARAGEHGKGFAVVAEEVRNLAQRSAAAAKDTGNLIEEAVRRAGEGNDIAKKTNEALGRIVEGVNQVSGLIEEIASATNEQAQGVDQVNRAVAEMDKLTQNNATSSEEAAASAEELNAQAGHLDEMVKELSMLIGLRENGGRQKDQRLLVQARAPMRRAAAKPAARAKKAVMTHEPGAVAAKKKSAEEAIPLEDDVGEF